MLKIDCLVSPFSFFFCSPSICFYYACSSPLNHLLRSSFSSTIILNLNNYHKQNIQHINNNDTYGKCTLYAGMYGLNIDIVHQAVVDLLWPHRTEGVQGCEIGGILSFTPYTIHLWKCSNRLVMESYLAFPLLITSLALQNHTDTSQFSFCSL